MIERIFHIRYLSGDGESLARIRERSYQRAVRRLRQADQLAIDAHQVAASWVHRPDLKITNSK